MDAKARDVLFGDDHPADPVAREEDAGLALGRGLRIDLHRAGNAISITQAQRIGGYDPAEPPIRQSISGISIPRSGPYQRAMEAIVAPLASLPVPSRQIVKDIRDKLPDTQSVRLDDYDFRREIKRYFRNTIKSMKEEKKQKHGLADKTFTAETFKTFLLAREKEPVGASENAKSQIVARDAYRTNVLKYLLLRVREARRTIHENPLVQLMTSEHRKRNIRKSVWTKRKAEYDRRKDRNPDAPPNAYYEHKEFKEADRGSRAKRQSVAVVELARELIDVDDVLNGKAKKRRHPKPTASVLRTAVAPDHLVIVPVAVVEEKTNPTPSHGAPEYDEVSNENDDDHKTFSVLSVQTTSPSATQRTNEIALLLLPKATQSQPTDLSRVDEKDEIDDLFAPLGNLSESDSEPEDAQEQSNTGVPELIRNETQTKPTIEVTIAPEAKAVTVPVPNHKQERIIQTITSRGAVSLQWISWVENAHAVLRAYTPKLVTGMDIKATDETPRTTIIKSRSPCLQIAWDGAPWLLAPEQGICRLETVKTGEEFVGGIIGPLVTVAMVIAFVCTQTRKDGENKAERDIFGPDASEYDLIYQAFNGSKRTGAPPVRQADIDALPSAIKTTDTKLLLSADCVLIAKGLRAAYTNCVDVSTGKTRIMPNGKQNVLDDLLYTYQRSESAVLGMGRYETHHAQYNIVQTFLECALLRAMMHEHELVNRFLYYTGVNLKRLIEPCIVYDQKKLFDSLKAIRHGVGKAINYFVQSPDVILKREDPDSYDAALFRMSTSDNDTSWKLAVYRDKIRTEFEKFGELPLASPMFKFKPFDEPEENKE